MTLSHRGLNNYDIILGGAEVTAKFPLHKFLNLEHRKNSSDDAEVIMKFKPMALTFKSNKSTTYSCKIPGPTSQPKTTTQNTQESSSASNMRTFCTCNQKN